MKKNHKKPYNSKLLFLGIISLIIILAVVTIGTLSGRYTFWLKKWQGSVVLGISDKLELSKTAEGMERILEGAVTKAREEVTKKVTESQGELKGRLEKEFQSMTSAQIRAIKLKICQDWGVMSAQQEE